MANLRVPKASDVLAGRLRQQILDGELPTGSALPVERELVTQSGLGRATVREALRILEIEGLLMTRPGRNGGTVVRRPNSASMTRSVEIFIRGSRLRLDSLLEVRGLIEPACAGFAARRRTDAEVDELERIEKALEDAFDKVGAFLATNVEWHIAIARMSHNELLAGFMEAIASGLLAGTDLEDFNSDEIRTGAIRAHRRICQAIRDRDFEAARRRMGRHVEAYDTAVMATAHPDEVKLD